jgi:hypothetical protein
MKKIKITFYDVKFLWETDAKYRIEYLEDNNFTDKDLLTIPREYKISLTNEDWQYFYFGTKFGFISPDSVFEDTNDYSDEAVKSELNDLLQELSGEYFTTYEYKVEVNSVKKWN